MKKIINNAILIVLLTIVISNIVLILCGFRIYAVKTSSMDPAIKKGSVVYVKTYKDNIYNHITLGSDITFITSGNEIVTHRIIEINQNNDYVLTQGISKNAAVDQKIGAKNIIGKVIFTIPLVGYIVLFSKNPYFIASIVLLILLFISGKHLLRELKKK